MKLSRKTKFNKLSLVMIFAHCKQKHNVTKNIPQQKQNKTVERERKREKKERKTDRKSKNIPKRKQWLFIFLVRIFYGYGNYRVAVPFVDPLKGSATKSIFFACKCNINTSAIYSTGKIGYLNYIHSVLNSQYLNFLWMDVSITTSYVQNIVGEVFKILNS